MWLPYRCALALCLTLLAGAPGAAPADTRWVTGWAAPSDYVGPALEPLTIRQVVRVTVAGKAVRVRLSNLFGDGPLTVRPVHVALRTSGPAIDPASDRALTFGGQGGVTIAKGESVVSDPVDLPVKALAELAVTFYLPQGAGVSTLHANGIQTAYLVKRRELAGAASLPGAETDDSRYFLSDVEVEAAAGARTLVVVGDSITEGIRSTADRDTRWPDLLAMRLQALPGIGPVAVVNSGIAGNRILNSFGAPYVGPSTLARFDRDALDKPGVRWVILLQGINDISGAELLPGPQDQVSAQQIIDGMQQLVARAHARGVKVWGATLLPRAGAPKPRPHTATMEAKRLALNHWIRTGGGFDGVLDFDLALRDPAQPDRLLPTLDGGDHTHPNDAGYLALANAVDLLRLLKD